MQCELPAGFKDLGLTQVNCVLDKCENCGTYPWPAVEVDIGEEVKKIWFYTYRTLPQQNNIPIISLLVTS